MALFRMNGPTERAVLDSFCGLGRIEASPNFGTAVQVRPGRQNMKYELNQRARQLLERVAASSAEFRVRETNVQDARIFDFGIRTEGGLDAGQALAEICMAGLGWASILPGDVGGVTWPHVFVTTDHPTAACLFSQYAGWQISTDGYFAMGSGPMRAAYAHEELYRPVRLPRGSRAKSSACSRDENFPRAAVVQYICERTGVTSDKLCLLIAPTASQAGNVQVVARSVETALHKLLELGFDVRQVQSASGSAPLPPVAANDMAGIGRTNDAILYGCPRHAVGSRCRRGAGGDRPLRAGLLVRGVWQALSRGVRGSGARLLQDRQEPVQPGRNHVLQPRHGQCPSLRPDRAGHHEAVLRDRRNVKIALLAQPGSWYSRDLTRAAIEHGHDSRQFDFSKLVGAVGGARSGPGGRTATICCRSTR